MVKREIWAHQNTTLAAHIFRIFTITRLHLYMSGSASSH